MDESLKCADCIPHDKKAYGKEWRRKHPNYHRNWKKRNPGYYKKYNEDHKEVMTAQFRKWYYTMTTEERREYYKKRDQLQQIKRKWLNLKKGLN